MAGVGTAMASPTILLLVGADCREHSAVNRRVVTCGARLHSREPASVESGFPVFVPRALTRTDRRSTVAR
jgi:hypothetical protein